MIGACNNKKEEKETLMSTQQALLQKIDSLGQSYIDKGDVMGFSIAVLQKDDTLYNKSFGYADSLKTKPVTGDHIFALASISKLVGSTIVMKLVEENVLGLDNSLLQLLPDFPNKEQASKITLRQLLAHTSGIQDYAVVIDSLYLATGSPPTKADYYNFFETQDLMFEPGTNFSYSNSGYVLMAMIVERVTKSPFQEQLDRVINSPHSLRIKLISEDPDNPLCSQYFDYRDSTFIHRPHWLWIKGDGGLATTAMDLAWFSKKWSRGEIISEKSFQEMTTPYTLNNELSSDYGLGVRNGFFLGEKVVGHTGGEQSTWAIMQLFQEKEITVVVLVNTNATPSSAMDISGDVALAVLGKEQPDAAKNEVTIEDLSSYVGEYKMLPKYPSKMRSLTLFMKENDPSLYQKVTGSDSEGLKLYYLGNGAFTYAHYPIDRRQFDRNEAGDVISFRDYYNGFFMRIGEKRKE
jgi:CubicO group peptidase (beta-lactamase class C family)